MSIGALLVAGLLAGAEPLSVTAVSVPLDASAPDLRTVGRLRYRGGLQLTSPDPRFGGLSGLHVSDDGSWLAITDEGCWVRGRLLYHDGRLVGVAGDSIGTLRDPGGSPLVDKRDQDAEELLVLDSGERIVSFERRHRILAYSAGDVAFAAPSLVAPPPDLETAPENGGLESLAALPDGRMLLLSERLHVAGGVRGWLGTPGAWHPFAVRVEGILRPAGAAALPDGDVVVLLRGFAPLTGTVVQVRRLPRARLENGTSLDGVRLAELRAPLTVDNFEAVAVRPGPRGETLLYLLSDDNFNPLQRTLLMVFELE